MSDLKTKKARAFDFNKYPKAKVAFRVAYHGSFHDGLAKQDNTSNTVEEIFVKALRKVRLIAEEGDPEDFSRCGRTDKGVSALGNVLCCIVRSHEKGKDAVDYIKMLNHVLPRTIRVVAYCNTVATDFDARWSCVLRRYRYYFSLVPLLDIHKMRDAASRLEGKHDFRNFCKMDVVNVDNFVRELHSVKIEVEVRPVVLQGDASEQFERGRNIPLVAFAEFVGNAFLYHQIRCSMTILFLVGLGEEDPEIVDDLLNLDKCPSKPQYPLADGTPLVLWDCSFKPSAVQWCTCPSSSSSSSCDDSNKRQVCSELMEISTALLLRSVAAQDMQRELETLWGKDSGRSSVELYGKKDQARFITGRDWTNQFLEATSAGNSMPLRCLGGGGKILQRPREDSYEKKVLALSGNKRRRLDENNCKKNGK